MNKEIKEKINMRTRNTKQDSRTERHDRMHTRSTKRMATESNSEAKDNGLRKDVASDSICSEIIMRTKKKQNVNHFESSSSSSSPASSSTSSSKKYKGLFDSSASSDTSISDETSTESSSSSFECNSKPIAKKKDC